jgi:diguanylate cyclase (GGDEF)-like protein
LIADDLTVSQDSITRDAAVDPVALTHDSLGPVATGVGSIFLGLAPVHLIVLGGRPGAVLALAALVTALVLFGVWIGLRTRFGWLMEQNAQEVFAGAAVLVAANTLLHVALAGNLWPTANVMLVVIGIGACLSSRARAFGMIVATDVAWGAITLSRDPDPMWGQSASQLAAASVIAVVLGVLRHKTVSRLERARRVMTDMAVTDELTGLRNRRGLLLAGEPMVELSRRTGREVTVCYLDVDGLKQVNDQQGHAAGDRLIGTTGEILEQVFRSADVVARLGGDEFAVLLSGIGDADIASLTTRLRDQLAAAGISASIGYARPDAEHGEESLEQLIDRADVAMYEVKRERRTATT